MLGLFIKIYVFFYYFDCLDMHDVVLNSPCRRAFAYPSEQRIIINVCLLSRKAIYSNQKNAKPSLSRTHIRMQIPIYGWVSGATILCVAVIAGLARATDPDAHRIDIKSVRAIKSYIENAVRLKKQALQDADLLQRLTDICFALAYINAARIIAPDSTLEEKCGVKVDELHVTLRALQRDCLDELEQHKM